MVIYNKLLFVLVVNCFLGTSFLCAQVEEAEETLNLEGILERYKEEKIIKTTLVDMDVLNVELNAAIKNGRYLWAVMELKKKGANEDVFSTIFINEEGSNYHWLNDEVYKISDPVALDDMIIFPWWDFLPLLCKIENSEILSSKEVEGDKFIEIMSTVTEKQMDDFLLKRNCKALDNALFEKSLFSAEFLKNKNIEAGKCVDLMEVLKGAKCFPLNFKIVYSYNHNTVKKFTIKGANGKLLSDYTPNESILIEFEKPVIPAIINHQVTGAEYREKRNQVLIP